uniref:Uncharacterized protein n=2 Tax=Tetradesmus obliquus TaxID=3088 RepID=A0A383VZK6_TETOB|eukprot:jgi/Sobl393_1/4977/SZX70877.1
MPGCCLAAAAQLTQLTHLKLSGSWEDAAQQLQQLLLRPLPLRELHLSVREQLPALDLSRLSQLAELKGNGALPEESVLPPMLQQLQLTPRTTEHLSIVSGCGPGSLQQLRQVTLDVWFGAEGRPQLLRLAHLPALEHAALHYEHTDAAVGTASAWQHLPQLQVLHVLLRTGTPRKEQMAAILAGLSAATSLTELALEAAALADDVSDDYDDVDEYKRQPVAACASLAGLSRLRDLSLSSASCLVEGDVLALTALTGLTKLDCSWMDDVDDAAATALACSLKQLRHLDLDCCRLVDMKCLAAIGHLTQLTALYLEGEWSRQQELMLLTGLSCLQELRIGASPEDLNEFWAAVRRGRQQQQQQQQQQ